MFGRLFIFKIDNRVAQTQNILRRFRSAILEAVGRREGIGIAQRQCSSAAIFRQFSETGFHFGFHTQGTLGQTRNDDVAVDVQTHCAGQYILHRVPSCLFSYNSGKYGPRQVKTFHVPGGEMGASDW